MLNKLLPTPAEHPPEEIPILRENLRLHLWDGSLYVFGMGLVSVQTILPVFIKELGGTPIAVGSVQVLWIIGQNIPSIFVAHLLRRRVLFKPPMVLWGLAHRLMLLVCAIATVMLVGTIPADITVPLFLLLIFLIPAIGSLSGLPWFQVFTKTVPVNLRGRLMGLRQLIGSAGGIISGSIISIILFAVTFPNNFALLFFFAFVSTMISFYFLTGLSERPSVLDAIGGNQPSVLSDARRILTTNANFRNFLIADIFLMMSLAASSFYPVYALEKFSLTPSYAGTFTAIFMVTNIAANIAFGFIGDTYGHKVNLLFIGLSSGAAALTAVLSTNILMYGLVFVFLSCATQIQVISRLTFIAELCRENERPVYVGIVNTISAPTVFIGIVFGWLIPQTGYAAIFLITSLLAAISFMILRRLVIDPRMK